MRSYTSVILLNLVPGRPFATVSRKRCSAREDHTRVSSGYTLCRFVWLFCACVASICFVRQLLPGYRSRAWHNRAVVFTIQTVFLLRATAGSCSRRKKTPRTMSPSSAWSTKTSRSFKSCTPEHKLDLAAFSETSKQILSRKSLSKSDDVLFVGHFWERIVLFASRGLESFTVERAKPTEAPQQIPRNLA